MRDGGARSRTSASWRAPPGGGWWKTRCGGMPSLPWRTNAGDCATLLAIFSREVLELVAPIRQRRKRERCMREGTFDLVCWRARQRKLHDQARAWAQPEPDGVVPVRLAPGRRGICTGRPAIARARLAPQRGRGRRPGVLETARAYTGLKTEGCETCAGGARGCACALRPTAACGPLAA